MCLSGHFVLLKDFARCVKSAGSCASNGFHTNKVEVEFLCNKEVEDVQSIHSFIKEANQSLKKIDDCGVKWR